MLQQLSNAHGIIVAHKSLHPPSLKSIGAGALSIKKHLVVCTHGWGHSVQQQQQSSCCVQPEYWRRRVQRSLLFFPKLQIHHSVSERHPSPSSSSTTVLSPQFCLEIVAEALQATSAQTEEAAQGGDEEEGATRSCYEFPHEALPTSSGYLPVSNSSSSRLFYVFYEATEEGKRSSSSSDTTTTTPLLLWLNGGPGCSSLIGCFYELGPWRVTEKGRLQPNQGAWNRRYGVLFVDNPVGTGYSIAENEQDIPRDQYTVASHLYYGLQSFFSENPSFKKRPLVLAGESYAGKYVPSLAFYMLSKASSKDDEQLQFSGMAIGNGLTDPRIQVQEHANVAHYLGLIDKQQSFEVQEMAREVVDHIDKAEWLKAHETRSELCNWITRISGIATLLDIRRSAKYHCREDGFEYLAPFLNSASTRAALRVDPYAPGWVSCRSSIRTLLAPDTMKSTKWMVEAVLKAGYPVLLYQGIYDAKDGPASSEAWMRAIEWDQSMMFWTSERGLWMVKGRLAGYWRQWKNLAHVVIQGAGHEVPVDQPTVSQAMIEAWIEDQIRHVKGEQASNS